MTVRNELLAASDAQIDDAVAYGDPMILRGLVYQLTGDEGVVDLELGNFMGNPINKCLVKDEQIALVRTKAATLLKAYRDAGAGELPLGPEDRLFASLGLTIGGELPEAERDIWLEQAAFDPWARALDWKVAEPPAERAQFNVAVIGAGLSGLNAAVQLQRAGIPFQVFEKNDEVGGTWYENQYPGARVDTQSRTYTHIFGAAFPYPYTYCPQEENMRYMRWVADTFAIRDKVQFNTEIESIVWDEQAQEWAITATGPNGKQVCRANAVITCVGFLSRPQLPEIEGMADFAGTSCHTAQWPKDLDLAGKRVAVIGSGATGYQTTPVIAKAAAETILFQRTPSWCIPNQLYLRRLPEQVLWLERNFPYFVNFARLRSSWILGPESMKRSFRIDPDFKDEHTLSPTNKAMRDGYVAFVNQKLAGRPELIDKMIPVAPPMSSRPIVIDVNDSVLDALAEGTAKLVSDPIERVTAKGIVAGGVEYPLDVIVYATGFRANDFLWPLEVRGRGGLRIEELWAKDGPRAYIGAMLPGFPNLFMAYGPNTNNLGGFQIIDLVEIEMRFALACIAGLIKQGKRTVDVSSQAYWRFNEELDREEQQMIYMDPRAHNYYQTGAGRSAVNLPIHFARIWRWLRDPESEPAPDAIDAGLRPWFGEDLQVA
jgi:4-hydroxyacetophenone monooxygenase